MNEEFLYNITEINKVNQRIKEYLWKAQLWKKTRQV